ncbi:hypothetical protein AN958_04214 [Leucoagaricus sp. SymC.cos]|nr:hypothetical protein AN958_04214 [Leucoagaricus sp. SymC.cos]
MAGRTVNFAARVGWRQKLQLSTSSPSLHRAHISATSSLPEGLEFWPAYFTSNEQNLLLRVSLHKLDNSESIRSRKRRRLYLKSLPSNFSEPTSMQDIFLPDEYYDFQEGHYDGVIRDYREMHLASWPEEEFEGLSSVLKRLYDLCPSRNVQTHLLHLASRGHILPHVDNIDASGSWILGVSIGHQRLLRLESIGDNTSFELLLPSGSVYMQSGDVRYKYKHSILHTSKNGCGQRLSIMVRVSSFHGQKNCAHVYPQDLPVSSTGP